MTATPDNYPRRPFEATARLSSFNRPKASEVARTPAFTIRMADISSLRPDGSIESHQLKVPALPVFDAALSAFARGTVLQSEKGPIAVEDLLPGDRLITAQGEACCVTWIGSATFAPNELRASAPLTRIMADSFGVSRPESFLTLGAAARVLQTPPSLRSDAGRTRLMTVASRFVDGTHVIEVSPPTPVRLYHLSLHRHAAVLAAGLEVETYHPGPQPTKTLSHTLRSVFMSMFPHVRNLTDFGPMMYQRAPEKSESV